MVNLMNAMAHPMNKNVQELRVNITHDLSIFKFLDGNRPANPQHVARLVKSIKTYGMLVNPILVNEKYEIIDGQHRFLAAREVGCPVYYIVLKGYALQQVHTLNMNQKNWTKAEFLHGYANMGLEDYIVLRDFWYKHQWLNLGDAIALCSNITSDFNLTRKPLVAKNGHVQDRSNDFLAGTWKIRDLNLAEINASKLKSIEPFFPEGYRSTSFVGTMLMLFNHENYNHDRFLRKLKVQPLALSKQASREQYKLLIEDIYNYKSRNKVSLRY
jgi:hypothetical protein